MCNKKLSIFYSQRRWNACKLLTDEPYFFHALKYNTKIEAFCLNQAGVENCFLLLRMRQLAAILFADMTGYTALMQENEDLARSKRKRFREVLDSAVQQYDGKILQYYGDGSLSIFNSAINSIDCAISIQQQLQTKPNVELRIGIHTGDIVMEDDSIYGDGVNLASRIESMAVPGAVFISGKVYDEIKNHEQKRSSLDILN